MGIKTIKSVKSYRKGLERLEVIFDALINTKKARSGNLVAVN